MTQTGLSSLPPELFEKILAHASNQTVLALSLVARPLQPICRRHLLRNLLLRNAKQTAPLVRQLQGNADLVSCVMGVTVLASFVHQGVRYYNAESWRTS